MNKVTLFNVLHRKNLKTMHSTLICPKGWESSMRHKCKRNLRWCSRLKLWQCLSSILDVGQMEVALHLRLAEISILLRYRISFCAFSKFAKNPIRGEYLI